jgi:hypothetical protein
MLAVRPAVGFDVSVVKHSFCNSVRPARVANPAPESNPPYWHLDDRRVYVGSFSVMVSHKSECVRAGTVTVNHDKTSQ